jgi:hypothetical protein
MFAKFPKLGERKGKNTLDSRLVAYDDFFWQEVYDKYQVSSTAHDDLAFEDLMFDGINPSVKPSHSWSKL